ncbi:MAG: 30S ribosomal protein S12 methylthiotransferase RimO [Gammaproteobacteria bacterium SHHR-1]
MTGAAPVIGFISLGCPKNLVDSERILSQLRAEGYRLSDNYAEAGLVLVNTCGFIDAAVEESLDTIGEALAENGRVIVTGCLGARAEDIRAAHPQVLAITGPHAYAEVMDLVHQHLPRPHEPWLELIPPQGVKLTPRHYAYLKIAEGCNHSCSFCIIPQFRGPLVSRPLGEILQEAERLAQAGVRELLVVAQDTPAYGVDLKYRPDFWQGRPLHSRIRDLAHALGELPLWVRLHYVYPYPQVDELIPLMLDERILPYLDMPLQHASEPILRAMRRPAASEKVLERMALWRRACPDLTLRSSFIVGFPGETEADFQCLLDFLQEAQLDRVGCFTYSPVAGASANRLANPVAEEIKQERYDRLMALQADISRAKLAQKIGQRMIVLVDEVEDEAIICRGPGDAPEIDGNLIIANQWELEAGDFVEVRVTGADEHDLYGEPVDQG